MGDLVSLKVVVKSLSTEPVPLHLAVTMKNSYDQLVVSRGTHGAGGDMYFLNPKQEVIFGVDIPLALESGNYTFSVGIGQIEDGHNWESFHGTGELGPLSVGWSLLEGVPPFYGPFGLPVQVTVASE
jgi:hypothetical protein